MLLSTLNRYVTELILNVWSVCIDYSVPFTYNLLYNKQHWIISLSCSFQGGDDVFHIRAQAEIVTVPDPEIQMVLALSLSLSWSKSANKHERTPLVFKLLSWMETLEGVFVDIL